MTPSHVPSWVLIVALWCKSPLVEGFVPLQQRQQQVSWPLFSSPSTRTRTVVAREEEDDDGYDDDDLRTMPAAARRESPRLLKAKQLLEQLSKRDVDDDFVQVRQPRKPRLVSSEEEEEQEDDEDAAIVVPDNFWSNGHLEEQRRDSPKFVTRWKSGVNVAEPLVQYDPIAAEKLLFRQPAKWVVRNWQIAFPLGFWAVNVVLDYLAGATENEDAQSQRRRDRAQQLTNSISSLGPAIIKAGQALSSRPDLLPSEYLEELQKLQDDVPRFSNKVAFETVEDELEVDSFFDVFELVEDEPVAAASIGQVYKARLLANDDIVALKIQVCGMVLWDGMCRKL